MNDEQMYERGEITQRGNRLFEEQIRAKLPPDAEPHAFVAIDVETGDFEVHERELEAMDRLEEREPEARGRIFLRRIGSRSAYHIGARARLDEASRGQA
jgi:hypothetical protein